MPDYQFAAVFIANFCPSYVTGSVANSPLRVVSKNVDSLRFNVGYAMLQPLVAELVVVTAVHGAVRGGVHRDVALRLLRQVRARPRRPLVLLRLHGRQERSGRDSVKTCRVGCRLHWSKY